MILVLDWLILTGEVRNNKNAAKIDTFGSIRCISGE